jgi:hypothetical protein
MGHLLVVSLRFENLFDQGHGVRTNGVDFVVFEKGLNKSGEFRRQIMVILDYLTRLREVFPTLIDNIEVKFRLVEFFRHHYAYVTLDYHLEALCLLKQFTR